jgi:signal transduction histidine kinase
MIIPKNPLEKTFQKITIFTIITIIFIISIIVFFLAPRIDEMLITEKKQALHENSLFITEIFNELNKQVEAGILTEEVAQEIALNMIIGFYNGENDDYFWINDINDGTILAHPFSYLLDEDFNALVDINGYAFGQEMLNMAQEKEYGFVEYQWPTRSNPEVSTTKVSHITKFEPWHWMLGTGIYIEDVEKEIWSIKQKIFGIFLFLLLLLVGLLIFVIKAGSQIEYQKEITEQKYRSLIKHLPIAVFRLELLENGSSSSPLLWNQALVDLFEFPNNDYILKNNIHIHDFLENKETRMKIISTVLKHGVDNGREIELRTLKGHKIWVRVFVCLIKEGESRFLDVSMENITKHKEATNLLEASYKELQKVDEMKSEIISITSHELRTPLTIIKGFTSILLQEQVGKLNELQHNYLERITKNTEQLLQMITKMLDLEKLKTGKMRSYVSKKNLNDLLINVHDNFAERCKKENKQLILNLSKTPIILVTDFSQLNQILTNLIDNAIKFTDADTGKIEIFTKKINSDKIEIHVKDNGSGISKKDLKNIFQKFNQVDTHLKRNNTGSGLGLSIVKKLIKQLGGTINVISDINIGSDFYITLTLSK